MKKLLIIISIILLATGCNNTMRTPTAAVEEFLGKYQSMDSEVLAQLDGVISNDTSMNDEQKKEYQALMEKQYQNLSYKVKEEDIDGDTATVLVEIEVYDYANSIGESRQYYLEHKDEFEKDKKDSDNKDDNMDDTKTEGLVEEILDSVFIDYKIKQLKDVTDKVKHEIVFNLVREDDMWVVEDISDMDRQKIHGLFEG